MSHVPIVPAKKADLETPTIYSVEPHQLQTGFIFNGLNKRDVLV